MSGSKDPFEVLYTIGNLIFADDVKDVSKGLFHTAEEIAKGESLIHHWLLGLAIMFGSALGKVWYAFECSRQAAKAFQKV